jgi:hypothetical protein
MNALVEALRTGNRWLAHAAFWTLIWLGWAIVFRAAYGLTSFAYTLVGIFPIIVVHECGHAFAARAFGWRVWVINAMPFSVRTQPRAFLFCGLDPGPDVGGFALVVPRGPRPSRFAELAIFAAGPAINLALSIALFTLAVTLWPTNNLFSAHSAIVPQALMLATATQSLAAFTLSAWPFQTRGGGMNDGLAVLRMLRGKTLHSGNDAVGTVAALWIHGVPPEYWDRWLVDEMKAIPFDEEGYAGGNYFLMLKAIESEDNAAARAAIAAYRAAEPEALGFGAVEAYLAAIEGDIAAAQTSLAAIGSLDDMAIDLLYFRRLASASVAILSDKSEEAARTLDALSNVTEARDYPNPYWKELILRTRKMTRNRKTINSP